MPDLTISAWLRFDAIRHALKLARPRRVLEIGVGEGALASWLARIYEYTGVEPDVQARSTAGARLKGLSGAEVLPTVPQAGSRPYDLVCAFEVLEHIEKDRETLAAWSSLLSPNGALLLSVPAHSDLFGPSDELVGHFRRYDREQLRALLDNEGFEVNSLRSYGAGLGHAIRLAQNSIARRRDSSASMAERTSASGRWFQPHSGSHSLVNYLVALPFRALQSPLAASNFGTGYVVLARRR